MLLIHGFTQTGASWGPVADALREFDVVRAEVPAAEDLWACAAAIAPSSPTVVVGYSMGGRIALHLALAHPDVVERLVLVGATGGLDTEDERAARRAADEALAVAIERDGVDAFLDRWVDQPLFATLPRTKADRAARQTDPSVLTAHLRRLGTGSQEPLWDKLSSIACPVLCVAGSLDTKFTALAHRMADAIGPRARVALIEGAGHACHLEQPAAFADLVREFVTA